MNLSLLLLAAMAVVAAAAADAEPAAAAPGGAASAEAAASADPDSASAAEPPKLTEDEELAMLEPRNGGGPGSKPRAESMSVPGSITVRAKPGGEAVVKMWARDDAGVLLGVSASGEREASFAFGEESASATGYVQVADGGPRGKAEATNKVWKRDAQGNRVKRKKKTGQWQGMDWDRVAGEWEETDEAEELVRPGDELYDEMERRRKSGPEVDIDALMTMSDADRKKAADVLRHQNSAAGPAMLFVELMDDVERDEDDLKELAKKWRDLLFSGGIEAQVYNIEGGKLLCSLQKGWNANHARDFIVDQPETREITWDSQTYPASGPRAPRNPEAVAAAAEATEERKAATAKRKSKEARKKMEKDDPEGFAAKKKKRKQAAKRKEAAQAGGEEF